ncbi:hypothetical protein DACRYDRAFT_17852 [Dacryopinax primogenitus]|uniref:Uncharacterized protein n=1 Tax=Dacryopinax primogenitus (strain DJM 731) TaxID=1858805 RepID=M5FPM0_DACPD|nr:uncharacterized protein DACRYDRAFT_17852 [Dacryopinax primogenitus]EJT98655.1 hypothetical protein DACRYDRAFT_17852 [Dacryopinax primogenitus]
MFSLVTSLSWPVLLGTGVLLLVVERAVGYWRSLAAVSYLPGLRYLFTTMSISGALFPASRYTPGPGGYPFWANRRTVYKNSKAEIASQVGWLGGAPLLMTNSPHVMKQILGNKTVWDKDELTIGGIAYQEVWSETAKTYYDCLIWDKERSFIMPDVPAITGKFALYLFAKSGFGIDLAWNESVGEKVNGLTMPDCFQVTS